MQISKKKLVMVILMCGSIFTFSCNNGEDEDEMSINCTDVDLVEPITNRGACSETLSFNNQVSISNNGITRTISSNSIPDHKVGLFGMGQGSLNPNAIAPVSGTYNVTMTPAITGATTTLLNPTSGPQYEFGILLNGVLLDPEAAEPWPHDGIMSGSAKNWEWNLDAMSVNLGLDCNNAHVQPSGKYHYHGAPTLYIDDLNLMPLTITLVGYAADGFPIYYAYGYENANDSNSNVVELGSSYQLRTGNRPGDGQSAPCGEYTGIYTNDYEYVAGLGDLDECNGRTGVTPEYPNGTYYYVITNSFPFVPRCLKGSPSDDFKFN